MKHIAQRSFALFAPLRQYNAAHLLLFPAAIHYKLCTIVQRMHHAIRANIRFIAEGVASAIWLLLLIFWLNIFAALV